MSVARFRQRPIEVDAVQFTGEPSSFDEVCHFLGSQQHGHGDFDDPPHVIIYVPEYAGEVLVLPGYWVYRSALSPDDVVHVSPPDAFVAEFEPLRGEAGR